MTNFGGVKRLLVLENDPRAMYTSLVSYTYDNDNNVVN